MSYYCDIMVASLWHHLERHELGDAIKIIALWPVEHELLKYGE